MARSPGTGEPGDTGHSREETAPVQDSSPARRVTETAIALATTPFVIARQLLPRDQPAIYYGGVTAAAVAGLIEWPVAAALAVGVWIARSGSADRSS